MNTVRIILVVLASLFVVLLILRGIDLLLRVLERLSRLSLKTVTVLREYRPVAARGAYLGAVIAFAGALMGLLTGSLLPTPILVFIVSASGLIGRILPRDRAVRGSA
jgi:ABC-type phosphate transport system permease subunit